MTVPVCVICAQPSGYWGTKPKRYCSDACIRRRPNPRKERPCQSCGKVRRAKRSTSVCRDCAVSRLHRNRQMAPCPRCLKPFWPWAGNPAHARKFCSRACIATPKVPPVSPPPRQLLTFSCEHCATTFEVHKPRRFCKTRCQLRAKTRRRKMFMRSKGLSLGRLPNYREVWLRSKGRCALCGKKIERQLQWPHPQSFSIDHVIPVAHGGTDDISNVQAAHLRCNIAKQARPCGSQLRLVI